MRFSFQHSTSNWQDPGTQQGPLDHNIIQAPEITWQARHCAAPPPAALAANSCSSDFERQQKVT